MVKEQGEVAQVDSILVQDTLEWCHICYILRINILYKKQKGGIETKVKEQDEKRGIPSSSRCLVQPFFGFSSREGSDSAN